MEFLSEDPPREEDSLFRKNIPKISFPDNNNEVVGGLAGYTPINTRGGQGELTSSHIRCNNLMLVHLATS